LGAKAVGRAANDAGAFAAALDEVASNGAIAAAPVARDAKAEAELKTPDDVGAVGTEEEAQSDEAQASRLSSADAAVLPQTSGVVVSLPAINVAAQSSLSSEPGSEPAGVGFAPVPPSEPSSAASAEKSAPPPENTKSASVANHVASDRAREIAAASSAVVAPIRPGKSTLSAEPALAAAQAEAAETKGDSGGGGGVVSPAPVGTARVRDVIDRALARAPAQVGGADEPSLTKGGAKSAEAANAGSVSSSASADVSASKARSELPVSSFQPIPTEEPSATAGLSSTAAPDAGPTEAAQSPGLSSLSRVTVETTAQIAAQIVKKLEGLSTRFEMALTPDDLGRVDITLDIDSDGALNATLAFDNPVAATELRGRADELRRQLIEAGFSVSDDALSFSERDPTAGQGGAFDQGSDPRNARAFGAASRRVVDADLSLQSPAWISLSLTPAGVDMKV
jgi:flagellar hook-length control protein FliK